MLALSIGFAVFTFGIAFITYFIGRRDDANSKRILRYLLTRERTYGGELIKAHPKYLHRGNVYMLLGILERDGLLSSKEDSGKIDEHNGKVRTYYRLTERGKEVARAQFRE